MNSNRPLSRPGVCRRSWPFVAAMFLAVCAAPLTDGVTKGPLLLVALAFLLLLLGVTAVLPWSRWPPRAQVVPALTVFVFVALLREAAGGSRSGYGALVLLPIIWLGLYGTRTQLFVAFGAMALTVIAPIMLIGAPGYPDTEWRRLIVWVLVAPIAGLVVQGLIRERSELLATVERLSRTDPLTGALNRRAWEDAVRAPLGHAARTGERVTVALLDLDNFKAFNDRHGHPAGDRLLKAATAAWQSELRPGDLLARYGGEEFAVLLRDCSPEVATDVIGRLRLATPQGETCSAGIAAWDGAEAPEALIQRVDRALYAAKRSGRNRVAFA